MVQSVLGGCKLDPKFAVQSNTPKVITANLQLSQCENKPAVNIKKVAVDVKKT